MGARILRAAIALAAACWLAAAQAGTLRICADPDNLPFSKAEGPERGLYLELAELVSRRIGETPEYVWWLTYNQRKALRNTILQDGCDAYFALPADRGYPVRGLLRTQPFLEVGYAIVAVPGLQVAGLADLNGRRVGVLHGSPPQILLAARPGAVVTTFREQDEALAALARGELDAALLWGPSAGYDNLRRFQGRWQVIPVSGEGLNGQVAVAVRAGHEDLARRIDQALSELQPEIRRLADKYGFPRARPLPLSALTIRAGFVRTAAEGGAMADDKAGRTRFNNLCSHCHGTDAVSPMSERDLRKLKTRYKEGWRETAITTIKNGRPDAGMPSWRASISDREIEEVLGFLATIQK